MFKEGYEDPESFTYHCRFTSFGAAVANAAYAAIINGHHIGSTNTQSAGSQCVWKKKIERKRLIYEAIIEQQ